jgi:hypothetical protein
MAIRKLNKIVERRKKEEMREVFKRICERSDKGKVAAQVLVK